MRRPEPLIFEISKPGRKAYSLPALDVPAKSIDGFCPKGSSESSLPSCRRSQKWTW